MFFYCVFTVEDVFVIQTHTTLYICVKIVLKLYVLVVNRVKNERVLKRVHELRYI